MHHEISKPSKPKVPAVRTVIYARFSSEVQNPKSVDDQIRLCRERAEREGWEVVEVFSDHAISGAAGIDAAARPGLHACLHLIESGGACVLLTESTDRVARQGDSFAVLERLRFAGARLITLLDGEIDDITGTIKGLMDARFRKDLAERIKRGQLGAVADRRSPAGRAYGYDKANRQDARGEWERGHRAINCEQADIVRRIFEEYAAGLSAKPQHPNAAKLFYDFVLSKPAQQRLRTLRRIPARPDIEPFSPRMEQSKLKLQVEPAQSGPQFNATIKEFREIFGL